MHIIEIPFNNKPEALAFLSALFYSDSVSAIGVRTQFALSPKGQPTEYPYKFIAAAINFDGDEETALDHRIIETIADNEANDGDDYDASELYLMKFYPETEVFSPETSAEALPSFVFQN